MSFFSFLTDTRQTHVYTKSLTRVTAAAEDVLDAIITPAQKEVWLRGCLHLAVAQDIIINDGPSYFVKHCLDTSLLKGRLKRKPGASKTMDSLVAKLCAIVAFVLVPALLPPLYVRSSLMHYSWGIHHVGNEPSIWEVMQMRESNYMRYEEFVINNVILNVTALRDVLASGAVSAENVLRLENQQLKEISRNPIVLLILSSAAIFILFFGLFVTMKFGHLRVVKNFVHMVLHPQFYTHDPRLKFATRTIFRIPLYTLVPVAWMSIVSTIVIVVPSCIFYFTQSVLLQVKGMPIALVAAWFTGKVYLQSLVFLADWILVGSKEELEIIRREFEIGTGQGRDTFWRLADTTRCAYSKVLTVEEVENLARFRSLEMLARLRVLEYAKSSSISSLSRARASIEGGAWGKLETALQDVEDPDTKIECRERFIKQCLLQSVIVVDTHNDSSWEVDFANWSIVSRRVGTEEE